MSEQSLVHDALLGNTRPSPISLNNKSVTRYPDQKVSSEVMKDNERDTPSDQSVTTARPQRIRRRSKYLDDYVTSKLCTRTKGKMVLKL